MTKLLKWKETYFWWIIIETIICNLFFAASEVIPEILVHDLLCIAIAVHLWSFVVGRIMTQFLQIMIMLKILDGVHLLTISVFIYCFKVTVHDTIRTLQSSLHGISDTIENKYAIKVRQNYLHVELTCPTLRSPTP